MKDEEFIFREDVREKAITARSARKRPSHSGCKLPHYTAKELRELSGPTYTVNLNKPMTYAAFKALPENLRKDYVQNIVTKYKVGASEIAVMMGANKQTFGCAMRALGVSLGKGFKPTEESKQLFRADYGVAETNAPTKKRLCKISHSALLAPSTLPRSRNSLKRLSRRGKKSVFR